MISSARYSPRLASILRPICFFAAVAVLLALPAWSGASGPDTKPEVQRQASAPFGGGAAVVSAEKTTFEEVTRKLDPGGSLFVYFGAAQFCDGLAQKLDQWRAPVLSLPNVPAEALANINRGFDLAESLIRKSGVESLTGVGLSGIALEPGLFQTKIVLHHYPDKGTGWMWSLCGTNSHPLDALNFLPPETAATAFSDLNFATLWTELRQQMVQSGFPEVAAGLGQFEAEFAQKAGVQWGDLVGSLGGEVGAIFTLDLGRKTTIPLPSGANLTIPEPGLLLALRVQNDVIFDRIDQELKKNPAVLAEDKDGLRMRTLPLPLPLPLTLRPSVARQGDYLFIATTDELIHRVLDVRAGKLPGFKGTEEFTSLAKGMNLQGNKFMFISHRFSRALIDLQKAGMAANPGPGPQLATFMEKAFGASAMGHSFSVSSCLPDGWMVVAHGNHDPAGALLLSTVVAPTAIMAGMTLPALARAKENAQSVNCMNNLKQIGLACHMYASDHNDAFPTSFLDLKQELGTPLVLTCPLDRGNMKPGDLTWSNLEPSAISYEFLVPAGAKATDDVAGKVLFRCRRHGIVCMGDGSVHKP